MVTGFEFSWSRSAVVAGPSNASGSCDEGDYLWGYVTTLDVPYWFLLLLAAMLPVAQAEAWGRGRSRMARERRFLPRILPSLAFALGSYVASVIVCLVCWLIAHPRIAANMSLPKCILFGRLSCVWCLGGLLVTLAWSRRRVSSLRRLLVANLLRGIVCGGFVSTSFMLIPRRYYETPLTAIFLAAGVLTWALHSMFGRSTLRDNVAAESAG